MVYSARIWRDAARCLAVEADPPPAKPGDSFLASTLTMQRRVGIGGKMLAVLLACWLVWLLAQGGLRIFMPAPAPRLPNAPLDTQSAARVIASSNLFGASSAPAAGPAQATSLNLKLKGVYAASGKLFSFAVLSIDGKPDVGIVVGSEIKPGVKLHEVHADHILIAHDGVIEQVNLGALQNSTLTPGQAAGMAMLNVQPTAANSYQVSRNEFVNLLQDPRQLLVLAQLGTAPTGGILINDAAAGGVVAKLGLRQGDIIQKINGVSVSGKDDLLKLAATSPNTPDVNVEGTRNGQPLRLTYNVQP
jgi:general secretion pathway protein C